MFELQSLFKPLKLKKSWGHPSYWYVYIIFYENINYSIITSGNITNNKL